MRFPTVFSGEQRLVEVSGEVYFEVARDAKRPFIVTVNNTQVEVTGTSFNINAYEDETAITTTLLTGGVNVRSGGAVKVLRPGQQASVAGNNISLKNDADMDAAVAWKNGMISFQGATLPEVMRKLARWYDLKVIYEGKIPETIFDGELPNTLQLSQVTKILTKVEIKFRIEEGNKLIVLAD
ncbi:DUF4974 domain-containing protein [Chitinophaga horti]|uniref:DUF4974 domain-containing protein n=1 Tax=Chitinophaga horti TaxID=2920382 RepID=A0ABY6JBL1_9BACT|nr:FecR family protein [Chitinophaga horti]UYQ95962.1 DUF4974 domain-containing protein [Chitinophaga horti]